MNIKHNNINPVELLRLKQGKTQAEFAVELGFRDHNEYGRNLKRFSRKLIQAINAVCGIDLTEEIIAFLCSENNRLTHEIKSLTGLSQPIRRTNACDPSFDNIIDGIK